MAARVPVTPELQRRLLTEYVAASAPQSADSRALAARFRLLPIYQDMSGFAGLRADGELLFVGWDPPHDPVVIEEAHYRRLALVVAGRDFPDLAHLRPDRPAEAVECPYCCGTGQVVINGRVAPPRVHCWCGGLGWVLPDEAAALRTEGA